MGFYLTSKAKNYHWGQISCPLPRPRPGQAAIPPSFTEREKEILFGKNSLTDASVIPKVIPQREKSIPFRAMWPECALPQRAFVTQWNYIFETESFEDTISDFYDM